MHRASANAEPTPIPPFQRATFATTHWSVVLSAGCQDSPQAAAALEKLCRAYWHPIYVFVRRQGRSIEDAQDLTQDFFSRLLEKAHLAKVNPERGRFRTFLLQSLKHFAIDEWRAAGRLKRGGGVEILSLDWTAEEDRIAAEPADASNPDAAYEARWAVTLIERVLSVLREEYVAGDRVRLFDELKGLIWGQQRTASYAEIAERLTLTEGTVKVAAHRLRQGFRARLRAEVADTVSRPEDIDDELRHLIRVAPSGLE